ncbi:MAG: twin-arginine translocase TatA/TatE family subunit [Vicinamibacterales bacterium]
MFGSLGMGELIIIFTVALIVFGPRKLPELGRSLGKSLQEFKRASNELRHTLDDEISVEERKAAPSPTAAAVAALPPTDPSLIETPSAPETIARGHEQN